MMEAWNAGGIRKNRWMDRWKDGDSERMGGEMESCLMVEKWTFVK